ncbi:hypothetical protein ACQEVG_00380 [Streptomyces sp. CA-135486]|uniref:hypothetical protein n=1 Tax=Streptomyces sp. CA-135486 TaxID=3240049 RepID=UPI003D8F85B4
MNQNELDDIAYRVASAATEFTPGHRPTARQVADAAAILRDMIQAVEIHGVQFAHFDGIGDFPRMVIQLVQYRDESR